MPPNASLSSRAPVPAGGPAPVSFWEWFCAAYPPNLFVYNQQHYFVTINVAGAGSSSGNLSIQVPIFCFSFRSFFFATATGAAPVFPIRLGIALLSGNDWTFGQWAQQVITGAGAAYDFPFYWPREVPASTQLTITAVNTLNAAIAMTGDAGIVGLEPRRREQPLRANMGPGMR